MKTKSILASVLLFHCLASAQGTSFTYQGRLTDSAGPVNGAAEMQFTLWNAESNGVQIAASTPASTFVSLSNGLFSVPVDFGSLAFTGGERWLQIHLRAGLEPFTTLAPRQALTATPYALTAANLAGALASDALSGLYSNSITISNAANIFSGLLFSGTFSGDGAALNSLDADQLSTGTVPDARLSPGVARASQVWLVAGNSGTNPTNGSFLGTADNQPLEIKVNGTRALRVEPNTNGAPNMIGGAPVNFVDPGIVGATIAGGGAVSGDFFLGTGSNRVSAIFGTIAGGRMHTVEADHAFIGGGIQNTVQPFAYDSVIGGGVGNTVHTNAGRSAIGGGSGHHIYAGDGTISGGSGNVISAGGGTISGGNGNNVGAGGSAASIAGGSGNLANGSFATVAGGLQNRANGYASTAAGGFGNWAMGDYSLAAGLNGRANHLATFVFSDASSGNSFNSTANNQFLIRAVGGTGIGTATPGATLDVRTTSATGNAIRFGFHTGGEGNLIAGPSRVGIATGDMVERISIPQGTGNVGIGTLSPSAKLHVVGNILASGTITPNSDVNAKTNFAPVNAADILDRVLKLTIQQWRFKAEPDDVKHVGPMAQDFRAAFGLGEFPTAIATVDADGVALAAIQGLHQKLEEKDAEIRELQSELATLKVAVRKLAQASE